MNKKRATTFDQVWWYEEPSLGDPACVCIPMSDGPGAVYLSRADLIAMVDAIDAEEPA